MKLIELLSNEQFISKIEQYHYNSTDSDYSKLKEQFESWVSSLISPKFIIPVLGVQGSGKSSFLNSLLMDDIVLPVEADETTCIPTEIVYSDELVNNAEVIFQDGRKDIIKCSEENLKPFVDNLLNPSNEKKVSHIVVKVKNKILGHGIVLVDLPGVGSLTKNNIETTIGYIKKSTGAIFMLRTVPPITNSESIFIQNAWPLMSQTFFIQNQWDDETLSEVIDGKEHNEKVLNKIAMKCGQNNNNLEVDIVNIYKALTSKLKDDQDKFEKSGIVQIQNKLKEFAEKWKTLITENISNNIKLLINGLIKNIDQKIESLQKDNIELENDYKEKRGNFEKEYLEKRKLVDEIINKLGLHKKELDDKIKQETKIAKENFRNNIRSVIREGITDGENLQNAFNDIQIEQANVIFEEIQPLMYEFISEIRDSISEISEFSFRKIDLDFNIGIDKKTKYEALLNPILSGAAGVGGMYGGAKLGAVVGTAFGGPGIGTIIGGVAGGIIGGLLGAFTSSKIEKTIVNSRGDQALKVIFPLIEQWEHEIISNLKLQLDDIIKELKKTIDEWLENSKNEFDFIEDSLKQNLSLNIEQKVTLKEELIRDKEAIINYLDYLGDNNETDTEETN